MSVFTSSILGQYETNQASQSTTDRVATDKDTFLKLLVAQLTHQDPLNPVEDKEFIAQLAQFTQVEELQNINSGIESLNAAYLQNQTTNAASLIGTMVVAKGDNLTLSGAANFTGEDDYPSIYINLPTASAGGTMTVWSTDANGNPVSPVYSTELPAWSAGRHEVKWHGGDYNDKPCADGTYIVSVACKDADGNSILADTSSSGYVVGVETSPDGNHTLYLNDGRTVSFNGVQLIMGVFSNGSPGDTTGDDTTGDDTTGNGSTPGDDTTGGGSTTGDETTVEGNG